MKINFDSCVSSIMEELKGVVSESQAKDLVDALSQRIQNSEQTNVEAKLKEATAGLIADLDKIHLINQRNAFMAEAAASSFGKSADMFGDKPFKGMLAYLEDSRHFANSAGRGINAIINGYATDFLGKLKARLQKAGVLDNFMKDTHVKEVFQEFYKPGSSGSEIAKNLRDIMYSLKEETVGLQNLHGSFINFLPEHVMRQTYSPLLIKKNFGPDRFKNALNFNRFLTPEEFNDTFQKWAAFMKPLLNPETTFKDSKPDSVLRGAFEGIMTGKHGPNQIAEGAEINMSFNAAGSLAKRASQQRLLHFKDGDSAYQAYGKLSTSPLSGGFIRELELAARNIGLMQQLGPNPEGTIREVINSKLDQYKEAGEEAKFANLDRNQHKLFSALASLNGALNKPENPTLAAATQSIISTLALSKLGKILFFAMPDRVLVHSVLTKHGMGSMDALANSLKLRPPQGSDERLRLAMLGGELRSFTSSVAGRFTNGSEAYLPSVIGNAQRAFFHMTGIHWSDEVCNAAIVGTLPRHLAMMADRKFENLTPEYQRIFKQYGIKPSEWDAWRSTAYGINEDGKQVARGAGKEDWITPDQFDKIPDEKIDALLNEENKNISPNNRTRMRNELVNKFQTWLSAQRDEGILLPGSKEHRQATFGTRSGTLEGSAARLLMMFKSWPLGVYNRIMQREMFGGGARSFKDWMAMEKNSNFHTTQLIAMSTIAGYLSMTVDDLLSGKNPRSFFKNGQFDTDSALAIARDSFLRGNAVSLFSDLLLREMDSSYNNIFATMGGPAVNTLIQGAGTLSQDIHGKGTAKGNISFIRNNIPFANLFYIKPALDNLVWFNIEEMLHKGSLKQSERLHKKDYNQDYWLAPSTINQALHN